MVDRTLSTKEMITLKPQLLALDRATFEKSDRNKKEQ